MIQMLPLTALLAPKALSFQWKSPEEIKKFQEKRLRYIIRYAYRNSAFYKRKFSECKITPDDIESLEDLAKLPIISKRELRENFSQVISSGYSERNCLIESTSGSTGEHIKIFHDYNALGYYGLINIRGHIALGLKPYHKTAYIRYKPVYQTFLQKLGLYRFEHIHSESPVSRIIERLMQIAPFTVNCYPTVMYLVARQIADNDAQSLSLHHIVSWSEKLTEKMRKTMEEKFDCPVYDQYGAYEFHSMAFECVEKSMHINADSVIIEFVKDGECVSSGERGEIVATSLWNKAMPFIRYQLKDVGVASSDMCQCGRGLPLMQELEGRKEDFLVTAYGDVVLPSTVITLFYPYDEIDVFQVIQRRRDKLVVKIVEGNNYSPRIEKEIICRFKDIFGDDSTISVEHVDEIEKTAGGKQRTLICEVD